MWQGANLCALSGGINIRKKSGWKKLRCLLQRNQLFHPDIGKKLNVMDYSCCYLPMKLCYLRFIRVSMETFNFKRERESNQIGVLRLQRYIFVCFSKIEFLFILILLISGQ
jgi:hypothetical protein